MATLINGNGNLAIYAQQDADWYAALMGGQTVITAVGNQFAYELLAANTIGVKDGVIITSEGRRIQLDANAIDSFDIPTGAQGTTNFYIIGYHLVTGDQSEQTCETFVQLMENGTDTIPEGSFRAGDDEVYISLYRVEQNDLTLGTITLLLPTVESLQEQMSDKVTKFSGTSGGNTYVTVDELAYDLVNSKLGLKVNGADTVIPFSSKTNPRIVTQTSYTTWTDGYSYAYRPTFNLFEPDEYNKTVWQDTGTVTCARTTLFNMFDFQRSNWNTCKIFALDKPLLFISEGTRTIIQPSGESPVFNGITSKLTILEL